ncbi:MULTISPECIES: type IV toxin-antitoxin system AbiEi family antitoxin domain-containing protein [Bacillus cereus group]|uniref:DNA-binding protein n=1 Tax=Bacillus thuringiensis serovar toumanoffi TaxID=180862 RepID=A0ABD5HU65_BACTU|nr:MULTISPECIES: type IV toxin-antitoxin system AbiEi family antitoxin domain-containing protein [Bacillus cereus group]EEM98331.1 hypothetical protein bthur0013_3390 [Bacillus thuringiensis IBL 200]MCR6778407.1 type IV toxin-antitoxin system AbiEi family antitoxin domain-containing protein [Bacillus thuringiensis]MCR6862465.1 type IV toxin-antitoxin system AbiEi family antitoxin domain-containing protein [Bacillus thuringiensis]MCR6868310.1 type IV toxin-antitoxin system AbiEi family antitoxin
MNLINIVGKAAKECEVTEKEFIKEVINHYLINSKDTIEYLNISKQRLSNMKKQGKLLEVEKGLYFRSEVEEFKLTQNKVREKYHQQKAYDLFPAYKEIGDTLIINSLRFFDCVTMVKHNCTNSIYNNHLENALTTILKYVTSNQDVFMLTHEGFDYVEDKLDIQENHMKQKFDKKYFKEYLESKTAYILGVNKIGNFNEVLNVLNETDSSNK